MLMNIIRSGVFAGLVAGIVTVILQLLFAVPIIAKSELFETGQIVFANNGVPFVKVSDIVAQMRSIPVIANTVVATILTCIGFGLILSAGIQLRNTNITVKQGAVWGIFAFMAFILAPSSGLPPELPGSGADTVYGRQGWWFLTVLLTIFGLWNLAFKEKLINIFIGVFLIAFPHIIGSPHPEAYIGPVPPELSAHFVSISLSISMIMWILIGMLIPVFSKD